MDSGIIIVLIIIAAGLLGILSFFLIKSLLIPRKAGSLNNLMKQGKLSQSVRTAKQILAKEPHNVDAHYTLAQAYQQEGKHELALMEYESINQIGDFTGICREIPFRKEIAALYHQFGQNEEALKEYILLSKLEPHDAEHLFHTGQLFEKRKKAAQALQFYNKTLKVDGRHAEAWFALGQLLYRVKKNKDAKYALEKALKLQADNFKAHFYLGYILRDEKNFAEALTAFERAQKDPEIKIRAIIERGFCFLMVQNFGMAQKELERVIKLAEGNEKLNEMMMARYFLSICYEKNRDLDKAIEQWEWLYSKKKNFRDVAEKLRQYQGLREDDRIKDFLTETAEGFEATCRRMVEGMNLSVTDYTSLPEGCQITAVERSDGQWRNTRKFPKFLRILRVPDTIDIPAVREFHEQMKRASVNRGVFIASAAFTRAAHDFVESRPIDLIPRDGLQKMLKNLDGKAGDGV